MGEGVSQVKLMPRTVAGMGSCVDPSSDVFAEDC
jgi:hypothetical protein